MNVSPSVVAIVSSVPMNVSTEPVLCCPKRIPCAEGGCYALKSLRLYPQTRKAWAKNARIAKTNPRSYFWQIANRIADRKPRHFRWHVAGDILNVDYLRQMCSIAAHSPRTQFLAFTKAFDIVNAYENTRALPPNLAVIFSAWPGMRIENPHGHRIVGQSLKTRPNHATFILWRSDGSGLRLAKHFLKIVLPDRRKRMRSVPASLISNGQHHVLAFGNAFNLNFHDPELRRIDEIVG